MNKKLAYLSDQLKATRRMLDDCRHGGLTLSGDEMDGFVHRFDEFVDLAIALENELSKTEWNRRAAVDRASLMTPNSIVVLEAMRPESNVVSFPRPSN